MTWSSPLTLSNLIEVVGEFAMNESELLAVIIHVINSGQVRLCGKLAGATLDLSRWSGQSSPYSKGVTA